MADHPLLTQRPDNRREPGHAPTGHRRPWSDLGAKSRAVLTITAPRLVAVGLGLALLAPASQAAPGVAIQVNRKVPSELNPPFTNGSGGAVEATPDQAAAFAWQEFIALNWPAGVQQGEPGQRETPSFTCKFGDPTCTGPTVWQTFRGKVEIFPGVGAPPGYPGPAGDTSFGYDALPKYTYDRPVPACDPSQAGNPAPWVNLDETDQITLDNMYAGHVLPTSSPGNSAPQLIRFLAKANRAEYVYVTKNSSPTDPTDQWWSNVPAAVVKATKAYLAQNKASPPAGSTTMVSLPNGTIEIKAGWRPLNPSELASGRFHTQPVRFYERAGSSTTAACYRDAVWGLVALHIIQKTPSAPYFIYATFEQADNIKTAGGTPIEDPDGNIVVAQTKPPTSPQECLIDPRPPVGPTNKNASSNGSVILTSNTATCAPLASQQYCATPGQRLFYHNAPSPQPVPSAGNICVNSRINKIPSYVITANLNAHAAIAAYLKSKSISSAPWLYYKLVNVQYYPYDKVITIPTPNGTPYTSQPPYSAQNPEVSSYYLANILVETNRSLQLFSGGLSPQPKAAVVTSWNVDGSQRKNTNYNGHFYAMGGCMGCHGAQGQNRPGSAGDFSVILAVGHVDAPEYPSQVTALGQLREVPRNRTTFGRDTAR